MQTHARTALEGLPGIVRAQATRWMLIGAAVVLALGVVVGAGVSTCIRHYVSSLRAELAEMEQTAAGLAGKTWRLKLATWEDERGIILPQDVTADRTAPLTDKSGRIAVILKP